jgi:hypothetical protein
MTMKIFERLPNRLFTFGCSFTNYAWSMWPEIISYDLKIPLYNFGRTGAGNQFIANTITQADAKYKFTPDDLIIVCWSNTCREDRWIVGEWLLPGNIYTQHEYDNKWIDKFVDPLGYLIRDLSTINLVDSFLNSKNCQYRFLSMIDIFHSADQWNEENSSFKSFNKLESSTGENLDIVQQLLLYYHEPIKKINKSFFEVLWNNNIQQKLDFELKKFNGFFQDAHPLPTESLRYLSTIFTEHTFKEETVNRVEEIDSKIFQTIYQYVNNTVLKRKPVPVWGFPPYISNKLINNFAIDKHPPPIIL